eukprot:scaffold10050_cov142-Amphora_coffeaeformis.AAC.9
MVERATHICLHHFRNHLWRCMRSSRGCQIWTSIIDRISEGIVSTDEVRSKKNKGCRAGCAGAEEG